MSVVELHRAAAIKVAKLLKLHPSTAPTWIASWAKGEEQRP